MGPKEVTLKNLVSKYILVLSSYLPLVVLGVECTLNTPYIECLGCLVKGFPKPDI